MKENSVLVVDGGGRGSALVDAYAKSPHVDTIYAVPGNDMMQDITDKPVYTFPSLKTTDTSAIVDICRENKVRLVDIAQDNAVEAGLGDILLREGILHIGPTRLAGQLEWDKGWSRQFMQDQHIPHPSFIVCCSVEEGYQYLNQQPDQPWVVKANGLAEGKGVLILENSAQAMQAIEEMQKFGIAGNTFLIEQMLTGEEFSLFAISDGEHYQIIEAAQDHKQVNDHDEGPNTGGMGCSSPPLLLTPQILHDVQTTILDRTFKGMQKIGRPYKGILYLGGMIVQTSDSQSPYVIEFNARWGDPEAQVIVPGILNDFFEVSMAVAQGNINQLNLKFDGKSRVSVAGTSRGYPNNYSSVKGKEIFGLKEASMLSGVTVYGAGVKKINNKYTAQGGRLFHVVGEGDTIINAREKAYQAMSIISIDDNNLHFRTDIGWRDVQRLRNNIHSK